MNVSWWQLLKALPELRKTAEGIGSKDWTASNSIWYQVLKSLVTVLTACGIYVALSAQEIETISAALALLVPTVCTLFDAGAAVWLRLRTGVPITGTAEAKKLADTITECRKEESTA